MSRGVAPHLCDSIRQDRIEALMMFGFSERQARFLLHVLVHSGVFLARQYCHFAGIAHGQKTHDFLRRLIDRKYVTVITPGKVHTGRLFHLQYKPLYEAIGEPDNRNRKVASLGRMVERLMLLDIVIRDRDHTWLGTESDKLSYFRACRLLEGNFRDQLYPRFVFGEGNRKTVRYFPDKLPIGIERAGGRDRHVFVYLIRQNIPSDFRVFLVRHAAVLSAVHEWTIRFVVPRRFRKASALYRWAVRDSLRPPLPERVEKAFDWYLRAKHGRDLRHVEAPQDLTFHQAAKKFGGAHFRALERAWLQDDYKSPSAAWSRSLRDQLECGRGRLEFIDLSHQYLQLTALIGVA